VTERHEDGFPARAFTKLLRLNEGLIQPLERPLLGWLAARMPAWVTPDLLTALGFAGAAVAFVAYAASPAWPALLWLASLGILLNWFGDSLDGNLARYRRIERPRYGFFLDHSVDVLNNLMICLGLGLAPGVRFETACLALIGYFMLTILTFIRTNVMNTLQISFIGIGPTELRIAVIGLNALLFFGVPPLVEWRAPLTIVDLLLLLWFAGTVVFFVAMLLIELPRLRRDDP